ncbi:unnamed protein product, partial [Chrysoparadoxa australica]
SLPSSAPTASTPKSVSLYAGGAPRAVFPGSGSVAGGGALVVGDSPIPGGAQFFAPATGNILPGGASTVNNAAAPAPEVIQPATATVQEASGESNSDDDEEDEEEDDFGDLPFSPPERSHQKVSSNEEEEQAQEAGEAPHHPQRGTAHKGSIFDTVCTVNGCAEEVLLWVVPRQDGLTFNAALAGEAGSQVSCLTASYHEVSHLVGQELTEDNVVEHCPDLVEKLAYQPDEVQEHC